MFVAVLNEQFKEAPGLSHDRRAGWSRLRNVISVIRLAAFSRDLGHPEPPLKLADVRALRSLDLRYYSSTDPGLVTELTHRFTLLARKTIPDLRNYLQTALSKSRIWAFWIPDVARILIDTEVPKPKHRWIEAHEIAHSIVPWHRKFLLGDNAQTLDPSVSRDAWRRRQITVQAVCCS